MKTALTLIGIVALAMGLLWMGQGLGYVRWPASSFMIEKPLDLLRRWNGGVGNSPHRVRAAIASVAVGAHIRDVVH